MWMLTPGLVVIWVVTLVVFGIVVGLAIHHQRTKGDLGVPILLLVAVMIFGTSLFGFLVSAWGPHTLADWRKPYLFRVVWQLGGGVLLAVCIVAQAPRARRRLQLFLFAVAWIVLGYLMANPALADLIDGPKIDGCTQVILPHTGVPLSGICR